MEGRKMRQSNVERDQWRVLCRERLSKHIRKSKEDYMEV